MSDSSGVLVPENVRRKNAERVRAHVDNLSGEEISFREPDQVNLLRAYLVQTAVNYSYHGQENSPSVQKTTLAALIGSSREVIESGT